MPRAPVIPFSAGSVDLSPEWQASADLAAHNLGFDKPLSDLTPEHWQLVLAGVEDRMRLRGVKAPPGWRRALARRVGRTEHESREGARVLALEAKREEIAAEVAAELGLSDLVALSAADRAIVDQQTNETIDGCNGNAPAPADCSDADARIVRLLSEYRALEELRADEDNVRLAEQGEVFAPENDA